MKRAEPTLERCGVPSIAVTGAKGGVGKSTLILNIAVALGRWGQRILLVDGDLGLANLDVLLGLNAPHSVEDLVRGSVAFEDVLIDGPSGVRILPAASGVPNLTRLDGESRERLLEILAHGASQVDRLLVDTGAGLGETTLALQFAASRVLLVTTPEPTSLVDAYATLKVLWTTRPDKPVSLVVNAARDEEEGRRTYRKIANAARQFLGAEPEWLGTVLEDPQVTEAVRQQRSVLELFPESKSARCYERIAMNLALPGAGVQAPESFWNGFEPSDPAKSLH